MPTAADGVSEARLSPIRRIRTGVRGETNIEVFFDLVYAFAVTQLSHYLLDHATLEGALQTVLLMSMVWLVWLFTVTVTNWLDPTHRAVRLMLLALMLVSLVMSASLPDAFGARGLAVGVAYATMQIGRTLFAVIALRGDPLLRNSQRLLVWCIVSGAFAIGGGIAQGHVRELLWVCAVAVDVLGGVFMLYVPGLGRSTTREWDIEGSHLAERCQSFVMIALGESIVVIGAGLAAHASISMVELAALAIAFTGAVAIWWIYFERSAAEAARVLAASPDPGRLGRAAYAWIHPVMIGGIIAIAAGDRGVLADPLATASVATTAMLLGGTVLFLAGHALFKVQIWHTRSWTRIGGIAILLGLGAVGPLMPALAVAACAAGVVVLVAVADYFRYIQMVVPREPPPGPPGRPPHRVGR
jgi:low temperature requirement protein LtrA